MTWYRFIIYFCVWPTLGYFIGIGIGHTFFHGSNLIVEQSTALVPGATVLYHGTRGTVQRLTVEEQSKNDDGYFFTPTGAIDVGPIRYVLFNSREALVAACNENGVGTRFASGGTCEQTIAWSAQTQSGECFIFAVDPAVEYRPQDIGHEFTHCLYGTWHD